MFVLVVGSWYVAILAGDAKISDEFDGSARYGVAEYVDDIAALGSQRGGDDALDPGAS